MARRKVLVTMWLEEEIEKKFFFSDNIRKSGDWKVLVATWLQKEVMEKLRSRINK
jgi:hypothetical protein